MYFAYIILSGSTHSQILSNINQKTINIDIATNKLGSPQFKAAMRHQTNSIRVLTETLRAKLKEEEKERKGDG